MSPIKSQRDSRRLLKIDLDLWERIDALCEAMNVQAKQERPPRPHMSRAALARAVLEWGLQEYERLAKVTPSRGPRRRAKSS